MAGLTSSEAGKQGSFLRIESWEPLAPNSQRSSHHTHWWGVVCRFRALEDCVGRFPALPVLTGPWSAWQWGIQDWEAFIAEV